MVYSTAMIHVSIRLEKLLDAYIHILNRASFLTRELIVGVITASTDVPTVVAAIVTDPQSVVDNYPVLMKGRGRLPGQLSRCVGRDDKRLQSRWLRWS